MFYKREYIHKKELDEFKDKYSYEFAYALYQKTKDISDSYNLGFIISEKNGIKTIEYPVITCDDSYWYSDGFENISTLEKRYVLEKYECDSLSISKVTEKDFLKLSKPLDTVKVEKAKKLLIDFHNIQHIEENIKDKNGDIYTIKIIENADPKVENQFIVDKLLLLKNNRQIGFVNAIYCTPYHLSQIVYDEHIHGPLERFNIATINMSRLDESFTNKGLGYVMYYNIAKHLNKKGIEFRSSTLQSDNAIRLWDGISKHFKDYVKHDLLNKQDVVSFLKVGVDTILNFVDNKPNIVKLK